MASTFISVPLKKSSEVDLVKPLSKFVAATYPAAGDEQAEHLRAVDELNKLRKSALGRPLDKHDSSLGDPAEVWSRLYFDQMSAVEPKFPFSENQLCLTFTWKDAFDRGSLFGGSVKLALASLGYEKTCVLFNAAALASQIATEQNLDSDEGLKAAAKYYQLASGAFGHIKDTVLSALNREPTMDISPDTVGALHHIMLAQAQEEVLPVLAAKHCIMQANAELYQSMLAKQKKQFGEEIARLQAVEYVSVKDLSDKINRALANAKKDNDFIYHDRVPEVKDLDHIGKAALAKPTAITPPLSHKFTDLFEKMVPMAVQQSMSVYNQRKAETVNRLVGTMREATNLCNGVLASLNLPAALEDLSGDSIPQSIAEKSRAIVSQGGLQTIEQMIRDLPELMTRNREILDEGDNFRSKLDVATQADQVAVNVLRTLLAQLDEVKRERETLETEIKAVTFDMNGRFLMALAQDGAINEEVLSLDQLDQQYGQYNQRVQTTTMASTFISVPLKKSSEVDLVKPLSKFVAATYPAAGDEQAEHLRAVDELNKLRKSALGRPLDKHDSSLEILLRYFDQMSAVEPKFPFSENQLCLTFTWKDAFDRGSLFGGSVKLALASLGYEKTCGCLFNAAALASQIATEQNLDSDEGLKAAAKYYQLASGAFGHIKDTVLSALNREPTMDISPDTVGALHHIMLAQAQEVFFLKATSDKMKEAIIAKLANQAADFYGDAFKQCQYKENLPKYFYFQEVLPVLAAKHCIMQANAELYQSMLAKQKKQFGEEIARLQTMASTFISVPLKKSSEVDLVKPLSKFVAATYPAAGDEQAEHLRAVDELNKLRKSALGRPLDKHDSSLEILLREPTMDISPDTAVEYVSVKDLSDKINRALANAKKDNDFIYHDRVKDLDHIGKAALAKPTAITPPLSHKFTDLFEKMVPMAVQQSMSVYNQRKAETVNRLVGTMREATNLCNGVLASLNLPAALEDLSGDSIPQSIAEKSRAIVSQGGLQTIEQMIRDLPELMTRNREILDESLKMLNDEETTDNELRSKFNQRWNRTPSGDLYKPLRAEGDNFRSKLDVATQADQVVRERFNTHCDMIALLCKPENELNAAIPSANPAKTLQGSETEIKAVTFDMNGRFLMALAQDGAINEEVLSLDQLDQQYGQYNQRVQTTLRRQEELLSQVQTAHQEFSGLKQSNAEANTREEVLKKLASAHDSYVEISSNLSEGTKTERDELLKYDPRPPSGKQNGCHFWRRFTTGGSL
ncbi:LOW QUALITY PROTEIN: hypothetical protein CRUP_011299 [Coryphaenoides rupestris]|nr:LOW QUALITY PROTEIN: hypothetical protein CRUP_011299 [Coryphaenoides rupestris]